MSVLVDRLRDLLAIEPLELAYLFGSEARGHAGAGSDVDVAVRAALPLPLLELGALAERLSTGCARRVQVIDLHAASPLLAAEVAREGILIVGDPGRRVDFEVAAMRRAIDTRPLRETQQWLLRERMSVGRPR